MSLGRKLFRFIAFMLAALALAAIFFFVAIGVPDSIAQVLFSKWGRFGVLTLVLLGFLIRVYWRARGRLAFWGLLLVFLVVHVLLLGYFYYTGVGLPFLLVGMVAGAEIAGFGLLVHCTLGIEPKLPSTSAK